MDINEHNESPLLCYLNGEILPLAEAKIGILTHAMSYGTGCFEGIRAYYNAGQDQLYVFRPHEHYERMRHSSSVLLIGLPHSPQELVDITTSLIAESDLHTDTYIRAMAYKATETIGVRLHGLSDGMYVTVQPFGDYIDTSHAIRACTSSWRRIDDNMIPARAKVTGAYVNSALAKSEAVLNGFDEAIMLDHPGHVCEGSAENLFMVRGSKVITPPVTSNILEGITRQTIVTLLREELGVEVEEREIDRTELYVCDELILCGTGAQIVPVGSVDHRQVGSGGVGELGSALQSLYLSVVRGNIAKYAHWCVPVYPPERLPAALQQTPVLAQAD
jgi:branched-chain amino acid aminotransferase